MQVDGAGGMESHEYRVVKVALIAGFRMHCPFDALGVLRDGGDVHRPSLTCRPHNFHLFISPRLSCIGKPRLPAAGDVLVPQSSC